MATMKRCRAQLSITVGDRTEHLWPGLEVNLDRVLIPECPGQHAYTLAHAIAGREDCFEDVDAPAAEKPASAPAVHSLAAPSPREEKG